MQSAPAEFDDWVRARGEALQRFAHLITGVKADAPDLVQEALSQAWSRWPALSASGTAEAYVRRCIVNASISRWRKQRRVVLVPRLAERGQAAAPAADQGFADAQLAWQLCATLAPAQRAAVVLRFYDDLPFSEIARVLECTESTARSHVHRALRALRAQLPEVSDD